MSGNRVIASESVNKLSEDNMAFMDFIDDTIGLLLRSERSFIICSKEGIPPILVKKDDDSIWVALLSEIQGI